MINFKHDLHISLSIFPRNLEIQFVVNDLDPTDLHNVPISFHQSLTYILELLNTIQYIKILYIQINIYICKTETSIVVNS